MSDFIKEYNEYVENGFDVLKKHIDDLKLKFQKTVWTDRESMVQSANEMWSFENKLKDYSEIHKIVLDNYRAG